jgi:cytoskeletal protein CcmA (bactofilin family)
MINPETTTILGQGSAFSGKLTFEGTVRIEGAFSGEIRTEGTLIVSETADVQAEIVSGSVIIEGTVRGDIAASRSIEIRSTGRMFGKLATPNLEIQKGSLFEGSCRMESADDEAAPASVASAEASS